MLVWAAVAVVVGFFVLCGTALTWNAHPRLRWMPLAYGLVSGVLTKLVRGEFDLAGIFEGLLFGVIFGAVAIFAIWIEREGRAPG